jgi:hypothetical protein
MHLLVPFAAASGKSGTSALQGLKLPHLQRLLSQLTPGERVAFDPTSLNLPHEHALAACRGWRPVDGALPLAAWAAHADGLPVQADQGWGLLTPTHWQVGSDQIVLVDPAQLQLDEDESRTLWQALQALFDGEGWSLHWGAPLRWYAVHDTLATLRTASLDRVIGQPIDRWLPERQAARTLRRLQSEAQMLLYTHPLNAAREARGALPVNSFWLWGTGRTQSLGPGAREPLVDERLRGPWLAQDWAAWAEAWQGLDALPLAELQACAERGDTVSLTLGGERATQRFDSVRRPAWQRLTQRWRGVDAAQTLATL